MNVNKIFEWMRLKMRGLKFYAIVTYVILGVLAVMGGSVALFIYGLSILNKINILYTVIAIGITTCCCLVVVVYSWFTNEVFVRDALKVDNRFNRSSNEPDWDFDPIYSWSFSNFSHRNDDN